MANTALIKRSSVANKAPTTSDLSLGELAVNTYDGKLFLKKSVGGTESIVDLTNADKLDGQDGSYYTGYTDTAISNLINSAPSTLDTLSEIASALNNDAALNTTLTNAIATKLPLAGGTLTGNLTLSSVTPQLIFTDTNHDPDYAIWNHNGVLRFLDTTNSNATRLEIQQSGLVVASNSFQVVGTCTATTFSGSGASLTNIPAAQLTGVLPALDGSNLTGVVASGTNASTLDNLDSTQFLRSDTNTLLNGILTVGGSSVSGNEGGEIRLTHAPNGSLSGSNVTIDMNGNNFRIFEDGGNTRGYYLSISAANNNASTKIWHEANDGSGSGLDADTLDGVNSTSFLRSDAADTATGTLTTRDIKLSSNYHLQRSNHHSGHLEGSYDNIGDNSQKSNPI